MKEKWNNLKLFIGRERAAFPASSLSSVVSPPFSSSTAHSVVFDWPNTAPAVTPEQRQVHKVKPRGVDNTGWGPHLYKRHWDSVHTFVPIEVFSALALCNGSDAPGADTDRTVLLVGGRNSLRGKMADLLLLTAIQETMMQHKHFWINRLVKCI